MDVKQNPNKTLCEYVKHFNTAILKAKDLNDEWVIQVFISEVCHKHLKYTLTDAPPIKLYKLYEKAQKYANTKDIEITNCKFKRSDQE